jgi:hypothetical protein
MKIKLLAPIAALVVTALALPAIGEDNLAAYEASLVTYFDRPGATMAMHDEDLLGCVKVVSPLVPPSAAGTGGLLSGVVTGWLNGVHYNAFFSQNLERCMLSRGWSVVRAPDADAAVLKMDQAAIRERLKSWVGQAAPHGWIVRRLDGPGELGLGQGIDAARSISFASLHIAPTPPPGDFRQEGYTISMGMALKRSERKPLSADQLKQPDPATAIVVVELHGAKADDYHAFGFKRMAASPLEFTHESPGPDAEWFSTPIPKNAFRNTEGKGSVTVAFAVHPGLWALTGSWLGDHCLMAPSLQVNAGDVLFLGSFDINDKWNPSMNLEPARVALSANPSLAENVRAAHWVNGLAWTCRNLFVNGYAIRGAPYQSDYPWRPL